MRVEAMAESPQPTSHSPDAPSDATLVFHEQADRRKAARLHGGKVVLVDHAQMDRVKDGEAWHVRLRHRDTFAIADPVERVTAATLESNGLPLMNPLAEALSRARTMEPRRPVAPPVTPRAPLATNASAADLVTPAPEAPPAAPSLTAAAPPPLTSRAIDIGRLLRPTDRVALFIDGANTDGAARAAGYIVRRRPVKVIRDQETGERIVSARGQISRELACVADKPIVYLEDHRAELARADRTPGARVRAGGERIGPGRSDAGSAVDAHTSRTTSTSSNPSKSRGFRV